MKKQTTKYPGPRRGTVPGIHKRSRFNTLWRHPGTASERRMNSLVLIEDGEVGPRVARTPRHLPTAWDDIYRGHSRSWKKYRRNRWR